MEKVINEFRVIETDDGYRIEIKGDKEFMKDFMHGAGRRHHRRGKRGGWGPGGFPFGPMMWAKMASCWDWEPGDEEHEHEPDVKVEKE